MRIAQDSAACRDARPHAPWRPFIFTGETLRDADRGGSADCRKCLEDREGRWRHAVQEEDVILILESMKMEIPVEAPCGGTLSEIRVAEGDSIEEGAVLAVID